jgi:hypothetical protein
MPERMGRRIRLSLPRRFVCDLMHYAQKAPTVPVQRRMNLGLLANARESIEPRPSWCGIFAKAYALVAARWPELRRAYVAYPWPHLYEHPVNIASIAVERRYEDEYAVFFAHMRSPELQRLDQIDRFLKEAKEEPVDRIPMFRWALRVSRLPRPVRRLLWWYGMRVAGYERARKLGTFGISVYSALGSDSLHPLSILTTALNYGVIQPNGDVDVRIIYDHRVLDGATVARILKELDDTLNHEILDDLRRLQPKSIDQRAGQSAAIARVG